MEDFSYLEFTEEIDTDEHNVPLVVSRRYTDNVEIAFLSDYGDTFDVVDRYGNIEYNFDKSAVDDRDFFIIRQKSFYRMRVGQQFYLRKMADDGVLSWSKPLVIIDDDKYTSVIKYRCNEPVFGFDYGKRNEFNAIRLPIHLHRPQFPQSDKIYQKSNGERKVLFSKVDKEYELETDYMPVEWHEKLIVALSHDEIWINEERLTKTGEYTIDYENEEFTDCGISLVKGSCKMSTNITLRNSNC